jgi:hypothetical protein
MGKCLLYTRVSETSRVHYDNSSLWTCPFRDQTQCQVVMPLEPRSIYCIHYNASFLYLNSASYKMEQSCDKAIKICVIELGPSLWHNL